MIYLPTDTLADWNGVLNGQKVYDYEASKYCQPETKELVDHIMRTEPIPKSVRDSCAQVHLDIANAESQIPQPNLDYIPAPSEVLMIRLGEYQDL
jgi:hypothetical protein